MGLFDREVIGDCGMLRSPREAEYREVYQKEKVYGMTDKELTEYLMARRVHIVDPYPDGEDTLH
jgi:hypothetical protein